MGAVSIPSFIISARAFVHSARAHSSFDVLFRAGEMPGAMHAAVVRSCVGYNVMDGTKSPATRVRLGPENREESKGGTKGPRLCYKGLQLSIEAWSRKSTVRDDCRRGRGCGGNAAACRALDNPSRSAARCSHVIPISAICRALCQRPSTHPGKLYYVEKKK